MAMMANYDFLVENNNVVCKEVAVRLTDEGLHPVPRTCLDSLVYKI